MPENASLLYGSNAHFVESLYEDFLHDPASVDAEWRQFFESMKEPGARPDVAHSPVQAAFAALVANGHRKVVAAPAASAHHGVSALIQAYRYKGHLQARFNPLRLADPEPVPELQLAYYGLTEQDLGQQIDLLGVKGTVRDVVARLADIYLGSIGYEFGYLPREEREWLRDRVESAKGRGQFNADAKKRILAKLNAAEGLERYLHKRYVGQKRFSLEGGDSLIPMMDTMIHRAGKQGVKDVVIGMAHRGRLNVLVNILGKKPSDLFLEFEGKKVLATDISGDVKYHLGFSSDVVTEGGPVHLSLAFNPSHLELINPVVEGSVRARQDRRGDRERTQVLPVTIHGDAAVIGQGVVHETINLSQLRGFKTGGTIHLVINNQVGFSVADHEDARSSRYCTDLAKVVEAPVFHVNEDDPEACVFAMELALDYRQTFHKDVFIDLVCYRRHGHNESDEPRATQPKMYRRIDTHPGTRALYAEALEKEGVLKAGEAQEMVDRFRDALDLGARVADAVETELKPEPNLPWAQYVGPACDWNAPAETGMPVAKLVELGERITTLPEGFVLHKRLEAIFKQRREMVAGKSPLDWGFAENLAYAGLVSQGYTVRICGQDSGRGTFFHRHARLHNQAEHITPENRTYVPLEHVGETQGRFEVIDSTLSEEAVLGFEYGYSTTEPNALVVWEAQYGDFANGAQAIIDQFIASGETKWQRYSGLVMMLPHGFEGQGPEHSSARLERYLALCAEDNMQVVVPSTPAQLFHMLRRQVCRSYRKPLIYMSPKSMLRHKLSVSSLEDLASGKFHEVIGDDRDAKGINRVILCSGKLYWELFEARQEHQLDNVAIVRVEQLYPFPEAQIKAELAKYPNAEVVWAQEEPQNNGAWLWIREDLTHCLQAGQRLSYASRPRSSSPAVGYPAKHLEQQLALITKALGVEKHSPQEAGAR